MKTLILTTTIQGRQINLLLPAEMNGSVFGLIPTDELLEGYINSSEYGKLNVYAEETDLRNEEIDEIELLIENSDFETFSSLLNEVELELKQYMLELVEDGDDEEVQEIKEEQNLLLEKYNVKQDETFKSKVIWEKFMLEVSNFLNKNKAATIQVKYEDLEKARIALIKSGIEII